MRLQTSGHLQLSFLVINTGCIWQSFTLLQSIDFQRSPPLDQENPKTDISSVIVTRDTDYSENRDKIMSPKDWKINQQSKMDGLHILREKTIQTQDHNMGTLCHPVFPLKLLFPLCPRQQAGLGLE